MIKIIVNVPSVALASCCALLTWLPSASAKMRMEGPFTSQDQKVNYLLYLQKEIPSLFEQGAEYDMDFLALIDGQNALIQALRSSAEFMAMAERRPPLTRIEISISQETKGGARTFDLAALSAEIQKSPGKRTEDPRATWSRLSHELDGVQRLPGFLTGLMGVLPDSLKADGFKLRSNDEKLDFLKANEPEASELRSKFKAEKFGLKSEDVTWKSVLEMASDWARTELEMADLFLSACSGKRTESCEELFADKEAWSAFLEGMGATETQLAAAEKIRQNLVNQYSKKQSRSKEERVPALTLAEVPPYVGAFRGMVGGDCSTSTSFPYVYMPQERTYFIQSVAGTVVGYLQATIVQDSQRQDHLYVHTISGREVSHRHIQLALHGLARSAEKLGFLSVLVPPKERIFKNINYASIHAALGKMSSPSHIGLNYPDAGIRQWLSSSAVTAAVGVPYSDGYDSPSANPIGHEVVLDKALLEKVSVEIHESNYLSIPEVNERLNRSEAILAALDLLAFEHSQVARQNLADTIEIVRQGVNIAGSIQPEFRREVARKILVPFKISLNEDGSLPVHFVLANRRNLGVQEYYGEISRALKLLGIDLTDDLVEARPYLFYEGHLSAPDAVSISDKTMARRSVHFTMAMIKRWPRADLAYSALAQNPALFEGSPQFRNFISQLLKGTPQDYAKLNAIVNAGVRLSHLNLGEMVPIVREKTQEPGLEPQDRKNLESILRILEAGPEGPCEGALLKGA